MKSESIYRWKHGKQRIQSYYESYLDTLAIEYKRTYVNTRYGKTHVLTTGPVNAKPIIILQGGNAINPMTLQWFRQLFKHYRIIAPDTIGHPGYSDEVRISAKDKSFANWILDIMSYFQVERSAFIGPSYGAGIILRLAANFPEKIDCAILVNPAGIHLGPKKDMVRKILIPLVRFHRTNSETHLQKITDHMSAGMMRQQDQQLIGEIFRYVKLERNMPKLTKRKELVNYQAPTMVITGESDVFFPGVKIFKTARSIIPNLISFHSYDMGHFPSDEYLSSINLDIKTFLTRYY
ncbi:alpha/beta fold hydrolase [Virgibacillus salexigens]|uniref:Carboxylesterase nap n=1 Tax=Virgibacillus kapii TaxID=1638645 RepID=A0ABQ2DLI6_9BACI|nr:alpha/beta hydrolase [Virgibacillus kapii]GGJ60334.1 putative carboxylesterase nap [Virgibacillus kapii]